MTHFKTWRVGFVLLLSAVVMAAMSFLSGPLGSQVAGALTTPTLVLNAATPNPAPLGTPVTFSATLSGGTLPITGDISLAAYSDSGCSTQAFTLDIPSNQGVNGNNTYTAPFTPAAAGTYYTWGAYFADTDGNNNSVGTTPAGCVPILTVTSAAATTSLTLWATPNPANSGDTVTFESTLSGGLSSPDEPIGQISLGFYTSPNCSNNPPSFTLAVNVDGNGTYTVGTETGLAPGTYYGNAYFADTDGFNTSASSGSCNYSLVVNPAAPAFTPHPIWWWFLLFLWLKFLGWWWLVW